MAGGLGKRMESNIPKVLHKIYNKPMLVHVIETSMKMKPIKIGIIVGKYREEIESTIKSYISDISKITFINQEIPKGTGHAIQCCIPFLSNYKNDNCIILSGDTPLIHFSTLENMVDKLGLAMILCTKKNNPYGYGRIILEENKCKKIVEEKDADTEQKKITLVNGGIYAFKITTILKYLPLISNNNAQKEYYLTEIFECLTNDNKIIDIYELNEARQFELMGVNTPDQLKELEKKSINFV